MATAIAVTAPLDLARALAHPDFRCLDLNVSRLPVCGRAQRLRPERRVRTRHELFQLRYRTAVRRHDLSDFFTARACPARHGHHTPALFVEGAAGKSFAA